jgi:protease-4
VASDVMWRELMRLREKMPIVASMSDLAASGGYYIAIPAHVIVAQPGTLTGSIGIVMGKFATGGTFGKLGMNIEGVSQGRFAEMNSPMRPYTADERAKLETHMQAFYDQFVEKVAAARATTPERIDAVARGRVWTGRQAKQVGLVDELGGLGRAIELAKARAGIPSDAAVRLVVYPPRKTFFEVVSESFGGDSSSLALQGASREERRLIRSLTVPMRLLERREPLALMPDIFLR